MAKLTQRRADEREQEDPSLFKEAELLAIVSALRIKKMPGQDKISSEALRLKWFHCGHPRYLLVVYNRLVKGNQFQRRGSGQE